MSKREKIGIIFTLGCFLIFFYVLFSIPHILFRKVPPIYKIHENQNLRIQNKNQETVNTVLEVNGISYYSEISSPTTVYDFMEKLQEEGKITFEGKTYPEMGIFIEEINGAKGTGDKYWIYYVNGKEADVGISNYKINTGDVVSWKYE